MKKIGILGGTFNPIHNAHLTIAMAAYEQYTLDEVWFMPAGTPPHKSVDQEISSSHRREMVLQAIGSYPMFHLCDIEIQKTKPCYTYKTLKKLKERYGDDTKFYFIIGGDSFFSFDEWVKPKEICKYADILVARRPEDIKHPQKAFQEKLLEYQRHYGNHFFEISVSLMDISSTDIRKMIMENHDAGAPVPDKVMTYIKAHHLYERVYSSNELMDMEKRIKKALKPQRYVHTIGVMHTAANLAFCHDYPYTKAMVAGLLHDCAKCLSDQERIDLCQQYDIEITAVEKKNPQLLHGKVGALLANIDYQINDDEILHAISVHTTGCVAMSMLDKIIYVADYMEPGRDKAPRLHEIRKVAYEDMDLCVYMILEDTMNYLLSHSDHIDDTTEKTYTYYKELIKERG
ncbi:MAG: nicotinate-nucleotide adenylyltransferase [Lachnospiraceae bacterium]|nr:nicotinate-nucleotide adenylyltransferase [Lachnospiraceae bacterium]